VSCQLCLIEIGELAGAPAAGVRALAAGPYGANYHGREALRRGLAEVWDAEPAGTLHLTLNPVIDPDPASPTAAVARSVLLIIAPGTPPTPVGSARITQYLRDGADGWRITRRSVEQ
jgi:hypothetical protein